MYSLAFFIRATPVRRTHSAQHSGGSSDDDAASRDFRRNASAKASATEQNVADAQDFTNSYERNDHRGLTLDDYVHSYGLQPHFKPSLKSFVKDVTSGKEGFSESAGKPLAFSNATALP